MSAKKDQTANEAILKSAGICDTNFRGLNYPIKGGSRDVIKTTGALFKVQEEQGGVQPFSGVVEEQLRASFSPGLKDGPDHQINIRNAEKVRKVNCRLRKEIKVFKARSKIFVNFSCLP